MADSHAAPANPTAPDSTPGNAWSDKESGSITYGWTDAETGWITWPCEKSGWYDVVGNPPTRPVDLQRAIKDEGIEIPNGSGVVLPDAKPEWSPLCPGRGKGSGRGLDRPVFEWIREWVRTPGGKGVGKNAWFQYDLDLGDLNRAPFLRLGDKIMFDAEGRRWIKNGHWDKEDEDRYKVWVFSIVV